MNRANLAASLVAPILLALSVIIVGCGTDTVDPIGPESVLPSEATAAVHKDDGRVGKRLLYSERFTRAAPGWIKVDGPGSLEVADGTFKHTTSGYSVWCEYAYSPRTFGNARYEIDVFVVNEVLATSFIWRAPDLSTVTADGGAYLATFNNSGYAPGPAGHFTIERLDPLGRTMLLDIPQQFLGLNRLVIEDTGSAIKVFINGVDYGVIDVGSLSPPQDGYIFLVGGDRGAGDHFDNITIRG